MDRVLRTSKFFPKVVMCINITHYTPVVGLDMLLHSNYDSKILMTAKLFMFSSRNTDERVIRSN